ncbi:MAG: TetR/AcrR family transcriptional regulator [Candidatus Cloacimonetes bacterium]|nr:TetR/AcrR family transcriptional regulator [Candidatus Cloacimonadota bacterium]MCF7813994.1 TetR/AcrR family transcriptional regulator [Candidatus Cloacimonadota bacterium]MCF7868622.1 TetR/AcrR family transcriptional regulator [Candidatus Cloacimonadota bacterium]MCF7882851.1 TetR/AcrR family transcriptional regulator [Candidatus Cloacimonadota bacterium]
MEPKKKILKSAMKIFLMKGYDATSMSDVVAETQTSKGGIYHHFKNKQELFVQCIDFLFDEFEKWEIEIYNTSTDVKDILRKYFNSLAYIHEFVSGITNSKDVLVDNFYRLMMEAFTKFPEIKKKHAETHAQGMEFLAGLLQQAQEQGRIKQDLDCKTLGFMMNALAEGTVLYHILNEKIDLQEMGQKLFETIWNGISTEEN